MLEVFMDFVSKLLSERVIKDNYAKIDSTNTMPANHGMKHILGTLKLTDIFAKVLNLSNREIEIIKTCLIFHDIGCIYGRDEHPYNSMLIAKEYLSGCEYFSDNELEVIYHAILHHDDFGDYSALKTRIDWFVNVIDKLDFSASRMEDNYKERFDYSESEDIDRLELFFDGKELKITIKTIDNPKVISPERIYNRNLICKSMMVFLGFCEEFKYTPKLFLEDKELYFDKFNKSVMVKR